MSTTAKLDVTTNPPTITVVSDERKVDAVVKILTYEIPMKGTLPIEILDKTGRTWKVQSDDGNTAVYVPA